MVSNAAAAGGGGRDDGHENDRTIEGKRGRSLEFNGVISLPTVGQDYDGLFRH